MAIKVEASRFALLKIEDDYDSDENDTKGGKGAKAKPGQASASSKKKNKKKKKPEQTKSNDANPTTNKSSAKKPTEVSESQWEQWQKLDSGKVDNMFDKDLEEAIRASKLQYEEMKRKENNGFENVPSSGKKKKKTGETMDGDKIEKKVVQEPVVVSEQGDASVQGRANKDGKKSKKDELPSDLSKQSAAKIDYKEEIVLKEQSILDFRASNKKLEDELQQVKKRNQLLCNILCQGEMKDQKTLMAELDELKQSRDKLAQEVTTCTSHLEKERSKVHALKAEMDKLKASKQHAQVAK